jgi:hypothetical protein
MLQMPGEYKTNTLKEIEKDYLFSWVVKTNLLRQQRRHRRFTHQNTRENLFNTISYNKKKRHYYWNTTLEHNPKLEFYSTDGQLVFTDKNGQFQNLQTRKTN